MLLSGILILMSLIPVNSQWLTGYNYRKTITIPAAQINGGPHANFPVLITITDHDLRTQANGGFVHNANGWDIAFSLDHVTTLEIIRLRVYNPGYWADGCMGQNSITYRWGQILFFISILGISSIVADPSTTSTWS